MTMAENQIQLTDIYEELTRLWDKEQGENKIRASLFNLILYVKKTERSDYFQQLVKSVVSKFPSRVIMILVSDNPDEEYLRTFVSSETIGEGELQIYCEIIQIEVAGKLIERAPFILLPHILPDLPVYLLWTEDPCCENAILPHLEPIADRVIFDAESTHDLQCYAGSVLSQIENFHCQIGDLNWSAISSWRHVFAQIFNTFDALSILEESHLIQIHYNRNTDPTAYHQHTEIEAAYFQTWLASRLDWKFKNLEMSEENIRLSYTNPTHEAVILLLPDEERDLNPGEITSVEIESQKNKSHYIFKRHPKTQQVFIQFSDKDRCDLPYFVGLSGVKAGQEILEEIFYPSTGKHFKEMLEMLSKMPWKKKS